MKVTKHTGYCEQTGKEIVFCCDFKHRKQLS